MSFHNFSGTSCYLLATTAHSPCGRAFSTVASRRAHVALGARVVQCCCCRVSGRARPFVVSATSRAAAAAAVQQAGRTRYARARSYYTCTCLPCVAGWLVLHTGRRARIRVLVYFGCTAISADWRGVSAPVRARVGLDSTSTTEVNAVCT